MTAGQNPPRVPASAGALIFDVQGRLLILKTTYKSGWSVPGGQIEEGGESPWEACARETLEECGLELERGRLACVDFLRPRPNKPGGLRLLFDCGSFSEQYLSRIKLHGMEIEQHRFVLISDAVELLTGPVGRRVAATVAAEGCVYLEDGRVVSGVS